MELIYERIDEREQPVTLRQVQAIAAEIVRTIRAADNVSAEDHGRATARH